MTMGEEVAVTGFVVQGLILLVSLVSGYVKLRTKVDYIADQTTRTNGTVAKIQSGGCDFRREHIQREIAEAAAQTQLDAQRAHNDADRAHTDSERKK